MNKQELKKAYDEGLINQESYKDELFKSETAPRPKKKEKRIYEHVNDDDFIKLLKHTKKPHHRIAFLLGFASGLRVSEIIGGRRNDGTIMQKLQPEDIHLKEHKIFVRQAKGRKDKLIVVRCYQSIHAAILHTQHYALYFLLNPVRWSLKLQHVPRRECHDLSIFLYVVK